MAAVRLLIWLMISITLLAGSAACVADEGYAPTPGSPSATYQLPVTGTVRDNTGQPIAAATVVGSVQGRPRMNPSSETDAAGRFALTLTVPLNPTQVSLSVTSGSYQPTRWTTTSVPGTDLTADIRLQRLLSVSADQPLATVLLPGDPAWTPWTGSVCGQCHLVSISTEGRSYIVSVIWSGSVQPTLWLAGFDASYDNAFQAIGTPIPGEQRLEATVPAGIWARAYVGLPTGVTLSDPLAYEISVRPN